MKTTIKVTVTGAVAPVPIETTIQKKGETKVITLTNDESFTDTLNLSDGTYVILVSGKNNPDGCTEVEITTEDSAGVTTVSKDKSCDSDFGLSFVI